MKAMNSFVPDFPAMVISDRAMTQRPLYGVSGCPRLRVVTLRVRVNPRIGASVRAASAERRVAW
jgi:hypothetical protein